MSAPFTQSDHFRDDHIEGHANVHIGHNRVMKIQDLPHWANGDEGDLNNVLHWIGPDSITMTRSFENSAFSPNDSVAKTFSPDKHENVLG